MVWSEEWLRQAGFAEIRPSCWILPFGTDLEFVFHGGEMSLMVSDGGDLQCVVPKIVSVEAFDRLRSAIEFANHQAGKESDAG